MGHTARVRIVLAHGAGSTVAAARALIGLDEQAEIIGVEDRSGDIAAVVEGIDAAVASTAECTHVMGVSLGAHALLRWAHGRARTPNLVCILPAWVGDGPHAARSATAYAADQVRTLGIRGALDAMPQDPSVAEVAELLRLSWSDYTSEHLHDSLVTASQSAGPSREELLDVESPVTIIGWYGDAFHPHGVALEWARHLRRPRVAMAARPSVPLLQRALRSLVAPSP